MGSPGPRARRPAAEIDLPVLGGGLGQGAGNTASRLDVIDLASGKTSLEEADGQCAAFSPDGRQLATAGLDGVVKLWETTGWREVLILRVHTDSVADLSFSPDGRYLASTSRDGTVRVWDGSPLEMRGDRRE